MLRSVLTTLAGLALASAASAQPPPPLGNWLTEGSDAVITTAMCGNALCGYISGIPLAMPGEPDPHRLSEPLAVPPDHHLRRSAGQR